MKTLLQLSLTGCCCVPVVLVVRFLLIKVLHSPRRYVYYLWLVVFLNLCLPFSLRVPVNFVPEWLNNPAAFLSTEPESSGETTVSGAGNDSQADVTAEAGDDAQAGVVAEADNDTEAAENMDLTADRITTLSSANDAAEEEWNRENQTAAGSAAAIGLAAICAQIGNLPQICARIGNLAETVSRKAASVTITVLSWPGLFGAWLTGLFLVLFYQGIVTFKMHRLLRAGHRVEGMERIYIVKNLSSPCLWGPFRPVICLPEGLEETERDYILCHERCHKRRGDHIAKWVLFLITAVHWFNPLVWLAYSFCCKDMEISCDEAVLGQSGEDVRKAYAASLLKYAARQNGYLFAPLNFGEPSLRARVSNILHYRKRGALVCGAALVIVLLVGAGLFLWAGNNGAGNIEESTGLEGAVEANISDDEEAELRYRISFPELFSEIADSNQEENEAAEITDLQKDEDTSLSDEERYSGILVSREEYPELYEAAEELLNAREAYKDQQADGIGNTVVSDSIHIFRNGLSDEVFVMTAMTSTGLAADDEVQLSFGVRLNEDSAYGMEIVDEIETADDTQERLTAYVQYIMENVADPVYMGYQLIYMDDDSCPELIVSGPDEATGFLILHYNDGTVYATQSKRLYYSYIPYGNLLLNAEGNMGLYTDDVYSIVDGQVTLIATGYRGLWAMQEGEIEWSGNNLDEDRYYWGGEELSEEEYAAALEAVYPSGQAVECDDIPYYSYREIVALLDESYLQEIPAAKG